MHCFQTIKDNKKQHEQNRKGRKKDTANSNYGEKQEITEDKKIAVHNNLTILIK